MSNKEQKISSEEDREDISSLQNQDRSAPTEPESYRSFSDEADSAVSSGSAPFSPRQTPDATGQSADERKIEALQSELDTAKDQMMRALAEADNARKRAQRERQDASKYAISGFSKDLLSVADNLRRALEAVPADLLDSHPQIRNLTDGIEATERELMRCFEKNGIRKILPIDQPFDPNFHEVMFEAPVPGKAPGTVIQIIETGYTLNDRILRPARVGVAKDDGKAPPPSPEDGAGHILDTEA